MRTDRLDHASVRIRAEKYRLDYTGYVLSEVPSVGSHTTRLSAERPPGTEQQLLKRPEVPFKTADAIPTA